jgi:hypothetical protein
MATFKLMLFKHPRSWTNGDEPTETREIEAADRKKAYDAALAEIGAAPASALAHPSDQFVLVDEEGVLVHEWDSTTA